MSKLDRYVLWQLMALFGFFSLVLVSVYWVNRAVRLFDQLISDGQSAWVFLEFTALSLPPLIRVVLPLAAFVAAVYVTNRLSGESELTVMQAGGLSPWRLARPVAVFGLAVAAMVAVLTNLLEPLSSRQLDSRRIEVQSDRTSQFMVEGSFVHPARGVTLYIREIARPGELLDLFLSDARAPGTETTYTARRAVLAASAGGPRLVMFDGMAQSLDRASGRLSVTRFADLSYDVGALLPAPGEAGPAPDHLGTLALLAAAPGTVALTGQPRAVLLSEGHARLSQPLLGLAGALLGFAPLMTGGFSRFGLWRQIGIGVAGIILVQFLSNSADSFARAAPGNWPVLYLPPLAGAVLALLMLGAAARVRRVARPGGPATSAPGLRPA